MKEIAKNQPDNNKPDPAVFLQHRYGLLRYLRTLRHFVVVREAGPAFVVCIITNEDAPAFAVFKGWDFDC